MAKWKLDGRLTITERNRGSMISRGILRSNGSTNTKSSNLFWILWNKKLTSLPEMAKPAPPHGKKWVFRINNPDQVDEDAMKMLERSSDIKLKIVGRESRQETGTVHFQGFAIFKDRLWRPQVQQRLGKRAWLDMAHGTTQQAIDYCRKEGKVIQ
jgi:hypothetical protein